MPDEFLERLGGVGVYFAWLEDVLEQLIQTLCGTKKTVVFTRRMTFSTKCDKIQELLKFSGDKEYVADVCEWIKECRNVARGRNTAIHSKHARLSQGWQRREGDENTNISAEQLANLKTLKTRIIDLHTRGMAYKDGRTERHHQIEEDDARFDEALDSLQETDE